MYSNLIRHPKVTNLADKLGLSSKDVGPNVIAAGMLVSLWLWAAQNATDGDLSECSDRAIAEAAEFKRKPSIFVEALMHAKLLDEDRKLHDWGEYATLLIDYEERQREQTRKRVAKHRARNNPAKETPCNSECNPDCNVTVTQCNAPTIPNHTLPYITLPDDTDANSTDSVTARAPSGYFGFDAFWLEYPKNSDRHRDSAISAWNRLNPNENGVAHIMSQLRLWKQSERWLEEDGRYIPKAEAFLDPKGEYLTKKPTSGKQGVPKGATGELGETELAAIQRVLRE